MPARRREHGYYRNCGQRRHYACRSNGCHSTTPGRSATSSLCHRRATAAQVCSAQRRSDAAKFTQVVMRIKDLWRSYCRKLEAQETERQGGRLRLESSPPDDQRGLFNGARRCPLNIALPVVRLPADCLMAAQPESTLTRTKVPETNVSSRPR
jgi:hypothetical protein